MSTDDQQFCLRWNNFQAYITSQFEALRDDEDFVDVTLACEGRRLGAHKVVLSACSPFFKELFKSNPCPHPIIFMRDVEVRHVVALLEFMYAGEVNVAQAQLAGFLRTAESLQIRGLTDASSRHQENDIYPDHPTSTSPSRRKLKSHSPSRGISSVSSTLTSEEPTPIKRLKPEEETPPEDIEDKLNPSINPFALQTKALHTEVDISAELIEPKIEPDFSEEGDEGNGYEEPVYGNLSGGMEIIPGTSGTPEISQESQQGCGSRRQTRSAAHWVQRLPSTTAAQPGQGRTVKLGEGIEICEEQLRGVKWSDYRKLTRGLATILFSPMELATCSVTGQRWSRAGNGERPVKPALDRAKVQAIISYVATRFPMVEISRIKQVLAYKCKENSTAFKMKAIRYFGSAEPFYSTKPFSTIP